eukprot:5157419-Pyramimonas_sp.AAC.2
MTMTTAMVVMIDDDNDDDDAFENTATKTPLYTFNRLTRTSPEVAGDLRNDCQHSLRWGTKRGHRRLPDQSW